MFPQKIACYDNFSNVFVHSTCWISRASTKRQWASFWVKGCPTRTRVSCTPCTRPDWGDLAEWGSNPICVIRVSWGSTARTVDTSVWATCVETLGRRECLARQTHSTHLVIEHYICQFWLSCCIKFPCRCRQQSAYVNSGPPDRSVLGVYVQQVAILPVLSHTFVPGLFSLDNQWTGLFINLLDFCSTA